MSAPGVPPLTREEELLLEMQRTSGVPMASPPGGVVKIDEPFVIDAGPPPAPYRSAGPQLEPRVGIDPTEPSPMALLGPTNATVKASPLPGGDLAAEQLAAAAITPAAPADETDRLLAANPVPPPLPPTPTGPLDVRAEAEKTLRERDDLRSQAEAAEQRENKARQGLAAAEQAAAEEKARVVREEAERQQKALDAANERTQAWLDKAEGEADKHAKMEYRDYFADKSTGHKILAGLTILFGAVGRAGGENQGMRIINSAIERDFRLQQARIEKQGSIARDAREGHRSALTQMHELRADLALKKAAALESVAAEGEALKRKTGVSLEQAATDKNIVAIRQEAGKERMGGLNTLHQWNVQDEQLKIAHERNAVMAARAKAKAKGGGGSAAGIPELVAMKEAGAPDSAIAKRADEMKLKPKDYLPSLANVARTLGASGGKGGVTDTQAKSAVYGRAIEDAMKNVGDASVLTQDILGKYQRNQLEAESADTSASKGYFMNKVVGGGRWAGLVAKSKFDGIPEAAQVALQQIEAAKESLARIHSGGAIPTPEDRAFADLWAPKFGDSPKLIATKLRQMNTEAQRLLALSGKAAGLTAGITNAEPEAPSGGQRLPGGNKMVTRRNKTTGEVRQFVQRPDGSLVPM